MADCNPTIVQNGVAIQQTGPRTVIVPADPIIWDESTSYEYLTLVASEDFGQGYVSKKDVPSGTPLTNTEYWVPVANFSAQLATIMQDMASINNMLENYVNLVEYGADPSGEKDSTSAINAAIADNAGKNIVFNPGTYKLTGQIVTPFANKVSIDFNGSTLKYDNQSSIESLIAIGYLNPGASNNLIGPSIFKNARIEITGNANYAINVHSYYLNCVLSNIEIHTPHNGIMLGSENPIDSYVFQCFINNTNPANSNGTFGINAGGTDYSVMSTRVYGFETCCVLNSGSIMNDCHFMGYTENNQQNMVGVSCNGNAQISTYYNDNIRIAIKCSGNASVVANNIFDYSYESIGNRVMFDCSEGSSTIKLNANNISVESVQDGDTYTTVLYPTTYNDNVFKNIHVDGINMNSNNLVPYDSSLRMGVFTATNFAANTWNRIGSAAIGNYGVLAFIVVAGNWCCAVEITNNGGTATITKNAIYGDAPSFGVNTVSNIDTLGKTGLIYVDIYVNPSTAILPNVIVTNNTKAIMLNEKIDFHSASQTASTPTVTN